MHHRHNGALTPCLSIDELDKRRSTMEQIREQAGDFGFEYRLLDRGEALELVPDLGPAVVGAIYTAYDGHCSPLALLRALHRAFRDCGGRYLPSRPVRRIHRSGGGFVAETCGGGTETGDLLILAAGLGCAELAPMVGLNAPVAPNRGHILVTERCRPLLDLSLGFIRQSGEGSFMMGYSVEEAGFDDRTSPGVLAETARQAVALLPLLEHLRVIRSWAGLRVLTPDGFPIYQQSADQPGAFVATSHSGVTLAAAHVFELAPAIAAARLPDDFAPFSGGRFDVSAPG